MKKILLITTGGTIASKKLRDGLSPVMTADELLKYIPYVKELCEIDSIAPYCIDSTNVRTENWLALKDIIKRNYDGYDGFVICHGTDTMAYTASALSYLIQDSCKPIVLTGSQRPINLDITDAKTNLFDSILFACDDRAHGVNIVFSGSVIAGTRAKKLKTRSYNAFSSINFPDIAVIRGGNVFFYIDDKKDKKEVKFFDKICDDIMLIKLIPGISIRDFEPIFASYRGIIIESFGLGGLPNYEGRDELILCLRNYIKSGGSILIATQVTNEGSDMEVYEVGNKIKNSLDVIESYDMTIEAAVTKLMWILSMTNEFSAVEDNFYRQINHDIFIQ